MVGVPVTSTGQATLPTPTSTASFWHSEPSKVLLGHRTTKNLPTSADVVIIGSGITGAFAAHYIAEDNEGRKLNVVMLEAREACWGATGRNGGHCAPKLFGNPPHISRFELANYRCIESLVQKHDIKCDWQSVEGCRGYVSEEMFHAAAEDLALMKTLDPELGDLLTIIKPGDKNPSLKDLRLGSAAVGGLTSKIAASLWPYKLIAWLLENLLERNQTAGGNQGSFNLQTKTPVNHLQSIGSGGWIVHTERGMIAAKKVLLATNGYTSHLLPAFSNLIVPIKGEMSSLIPPAAVRPDTGKECSGINSYGFLGNEQQNAQQDDYLVQRPFVSSKGGKLTGGELMFGGGRSHTAGQGFGVSDDTEIDKPTAKYLRRSLNKLLDLKNDGKELKASYEWSGIMGYSRDGRPWCGKVPRGINGGDGLFLCAGFTGHGMPNASLCAKNVASAMLDKEADVNFPAEFWISEDRIAKANLMPLCQDTIV